MQKDRTIPLNKDSLEERFHRCKERQLAVVSAKHQRNWNTHLPRCARLNLLHIGSADVGLFPVLVNVVVYSDFWLDIFVDVFSDLWGIVYLSC